MSDVQPAGTAANCIVKTLVEYDILGPETSSTHFATAKDKGSHAIANTLLKDLSDEQASFI